MRNARGTGEVAGRFGACKGNDHPESERDDPQEIPPQSDPAVVALIALAQRWMQVPTAPQPMELAIGFRRALQAEAAFVGRRRRSTRIRALYPLYCHSLGISRPPPYKDFAKELAKLMPRSVMDTRPGGRKTVTVYTVPDPAAVAEVTPLKRA